MSYYTKFKDAEAARKPGQVTLLHPTKGYYNGVDLHAYGRG